MGEVWITGAGAVSAAGIGREPLARLLSEGATAVGRQSAGGEKLRVIRPQTQD